MNRDWDKDIELCEKATRGPWREFTDSYGHNIGTKMIDPQLKAHAPVVTLAMSAFGSTVYISQVDSDFIIGAREALPYWLQQYAELKERNDDMLKVLERIKADIDEFRSYIDIEACESVEDQARAFNELLRAERKRADRSEIALLQLQESIVWIKTKHEFEWTYEPGIGEVVYEIINVLENGTEF